MDVLKLKWSFSRQYFFLDWNKQQQLNEITKICKENFIETAVLSNTAFFLKNTQASGWEDWSSSSLGIPLWRKHLHKLHSNNNIGHKTK